jgi:hypothetical protein
VIIGNAETSMILVAFGTTPDAAATAETAATSAGVPLGAGAVMALMVKENDKISAKALA